MQRFLSQPFFVAEVVHRHARASTSGSRTRSAASSEIIEGKHDELPEQAFYMVGAIERRVERGKQLAAV